MDMVHTLAFAAKGELEASILMEETTPFWGYGML
jgi:hypothetical protein